MVRTSELPIARIQAVRYYEFADIIEPQGWPSIIDERDEIDAIRAISVDAELREISGWDYFTHLLTLNGAPEWVWRTWLVALDTDTES